MLFKRCVDGLSQKKFDKIEIKEIDAALCGKRNTVFKIKKIQDRPFNWNIIDSELGALLNK